MRWIPYSQYVTAAKSGHIYAPVICSRSFGIHIRYMCIQLSRCGTVNVQILSDTYMKLMIAEFGTDHYYQADGFFNSAKGPWTAAQQQQQQQQQQAKELETQQRPSCRFSGALNMTYIKNCPDPRLPDNCKPYLHKTLGSAQAACDALGTWYVRTAGGAAPSSPL